jgi:hypothetical protein
MRSFQAKSLLPVYALGVLGAFLQIAAAQWDVSAHLLGIVETFFTPAHGLLYAGIGLVALANLQGLRLWLAREDNQSYKTLFTGLRIAVIGTALQLVAAPIDFWWHSNYGFDPYLFTPPHSLLITGMVLGGLGMSIGIVRLLQAQRKGLQLTDRPWLVTVFVVLGIASVWAQLYFFSYWITDLYGIAYTFGYCNINQFNAGTCSFVNDYRTYANLVSFGLFAAAGTLAFWATKKIFLDKMGVFTLTALVLIGIYAGPALGFASYALQYMNPPGSFYISNSTATYGVTIATFILTYLAVVVPVIILDFAVRSSLAKLKLSFVLLSALTGPILAFVDGRFALGISEAHLSLSALTIAFSFMVIGGVLGGIVLTRLAPRLSLGLHVPQIGWRTGPLTKETHPIRHAD